MSSAKSNEFGGSKPKFEGLPDEVMVHILSYVDASSLYNFSGLNNRFENLVRSKSLWRHVDGRSRALPNRSRKLAAFCMQNVHDGTKSLLISARSRFKRLFPSNWPFRQPDYNKLTVLALENQRFPHYVALKSFPTGLHELSLRNSYSDTNETFFKHSDAAMSELRVLILDGCRWVRTWVLVSVSKYPKLQVLSMVRCTKALDDDVYVGMAAVYGFYSLRVCDVRHTKFADGLVSAMALYKPQLRSLYFASYSAAFYPDIIAQMRQQLHQQNWQQRLECVGEEMDFDERKVSVCSQLLGDVRSKAGFRCQANSYQNITDKAMFNFRRLRDSDNDADFANMLIDEVIADHHSLLYKDPYSVPCPCKDPCVKISETVQDPLPEWPVCNFRPLRPEYPLQNLNAIQEQHEHIPNSVMLDDKSKNMQRRKRRRMDEMYTTVPYGYSYEQGALEVTFDEIWKEVPGDEYESCCRAYNAAAAQEHSLNIGTTSNNHLQQSRKRKRTCSSSSSNDSTATNSTIDSSSSDSESDSDSYPRRKRRARKKPRLQQPCSPKVISISVPESDFPDIRDEDIIYDDDPVVIRAAPADGLDQDRGGIQVIPAQQLHETVPSRLTQLSLRGYKTITDATLDSLAHLHNMRLIDVTGTKVTAAGVRKYMMSHPNCRIVHQSICSCIPTMRI